MKKDKKEIILLSALDEFAKEGYKSASTNKICEAASVSKGIIFLYFKSKANLYYEVFKDCLAKMLEAINHLIIKDEDDLIEKILLVTNWKMEYFVKNPLDAKLMIEALTNPPPVLKENLYNHMEELKIITIDKFFDNLDLSIYDPKYSKEEIIMNYKIAINGLQQTYMQGNVTLEYLAKIKSQCADHLKIIMKGMMKE